MRTLITLLLTLLLSPCVHNVHGSTPVETEADQAEATQKPETTTVKPDSCPGYIEGNEYTLYECTKRSYVVHESGKLALEEALEEEEEEAEE